MVSGDLWLLRAGIQVMTKAAALCEAAGNAEDAGLTYSMMQWCHVCTGDFDQVLALQAPLLRTMEQRLHIRWYAWGLAAVSAAYTGLGRGRTRWKRPTRRCAWGRPLQTGPPCPSLPGASRWPICIKATWCGRSTIEELAIQHARTLADKVWGPVCPCRGTVSSWGAASRVGDAGRECAHVSRGAHRRGGGD